MKLRGSRLGLAIVCVLGFLVLSADPGLWAQRKSLATNEAQRVRFNNGWYKPPPPTLDPNLGISVPGGLIEPVLKSTRQQAGLRLRNQNLCALSNEEAREFAGIDNAEGILEDEIASLLNSLQTIAESPIEPEQFPKTDANELEIMRQRRLDNIKSLRAEIDVLTTWKYKLQPYLVKSMEAQPRGVFGGTLLGDTLLIVSGPIHGGATIQRRCPVVVFLPIQPQRIYTALNASL